MKKVILMFFASLFVTQFMSAQLKVRSNGSVWQGYNGYANIYMGTYPAYGYDNGKWAFEVWGENLNIWKPWPSFNNGEGNYYMFLTPAGGVGIGKVPTQTGICLDVNGKVYSYGIELTSDERLKTDIKPLTDKLDNLYLLNGKSYKKQSVEDEVALPDITDEKGNILKKYEKSTNKKRQEITEFGFLAQELKGIYPELVSQDTLGYYYVNYIGLIPVLVEAMKVQKLQIDELTTKINDLSLSGPHKVNSSNETLTDLLTYPVLEQNTPNPFNTATIINYYLPRTVSDANIYIYTMNGEQLRNISLTDRGKSYVTIQGNVLNAGMYLYALIADGRVIDTKRMVLTK